MVNLIALTLLAETNLSSMHSPLDLRNMVEDYFCSLSDFKLETDSDSYFTDKW